MTSRVPKKGYPKRHVYVDRLNYLHYSDVLAKQKSGIWNLESGIWNLESGIWNLDPETGLTIFHLYIHLSLKKKLGKIIFWGAISFALHQAQFVDTF